MKNEDGKNTGTRNQKREKDTPTSESYPGIRKMTTPFYSASYLFEDF